MRQVEGKDNDSGVVDIIFVPSSFPCLCVPLFVLTIQDHHCRRHHLLPCFFVRVSHSAMTNITIQDDDNHITCCHQNRFVTHRFFSVYGFLFYNSGPDSLSLSCFLFSYVAHCFDGACVVA